jgi:outer membrane usher protein FimD/PapC
LSRKKRAWTRSESHTAQASLSRDFSKTTSLSARYTYQQYLREDFADDVSHVVGLGYKTGLGRRFSLDLFAGVRLQEGNTQESDVKPDWSVTLNHTGRSSQLSLGYSRTRNYVPTTEGFTDTEWAHLTWQYQRGRFLASLTGGYAHNGLEREAEAALGQDFESWRGAFRTAYMLKRWLGLAAVYDYQWQRSQDPRFGDRGRHLAQVGLILTPWSDRTPQGLN